MAGPDELLSTIEAIYAAGLDAELWPAALAGIAQAVGGTTCTLELFDKHSLRPRQIFSHGLPSPAELKYLDHYVKLNRRLPVAARAKAGELMWDYRIFDERTMARDPFYAEFLCKFEAWYFVAGIVTANADEFAGLVVHRPRKGGHFDKAEIATIGRLARHVRQAFETTRRLAGASALGESIDAGLDWLTDGVALIRPDGTLLHANEALQAIARRGDGVAIRKGVLEFLTHSARDRFAAAFTVLSARQWGDADACRAADFPAARVTGGLPYVVAVRPLARDGGHLRGRAAAIVFIRDPLCGGATTLSLMREVFGFTEAEAGVAQALHAGVPLGDYARAKAVSLNTVYTHLRRIKEKTGCRRMPGLIRKLNDMQASVRQIR